MKISYDKNGNILNLDRNGYGTELDMDRFAYNYLTINGEQSNRLDYVNDSGTDYTSYEDIKTGQTTGNYTYNRIGELIEDVQEQMTLEWRYGDHKLSKIYRGTNTTTPQLEFVYNPLGVRVAKIMRTQNDGTVLALDEQTVTYYAYDANGQLMAVYESLLYDESGGTTLEEQYIYGSSRVGVIKQNKTVYFGGLELEFASSYRSNTLGKKRYELSNHLGNVLSTVSDRKVWNSTDNHYEAVVTSWADYYAFGMMMPNRHGGELGRHLFNGMEHDGEVSGNGNSYTTEFRQYDPRLGRWKSLDPLMKMFPSMSPYCAFDDNPIYYVDPYGLSSSNPDGEPEIDPLSETTEKSSPGMMGDWSGGSTGWCPECATPEFDNGNNGPSDYSGPRAVDQTHAPKGDPLRDWGHMGTYTYESGQSIDLYYDQVSNERFWIKQYYGAGNKREYAYWNSTANAYVGFDANFHCTSCEIKEIGLEAIDIVVYYGGPAIKIIGGVVAVAAALPTGGASLAGWGAVAGTFSVISGTFAAATGMVEIVLKADGQDALVKKIPSGYLNATIGAIVSRNVDDPSIVQWVEFSLNVIEGGQIKISGAASDLKLLDNLISSGQQIEYIVTENPLPNK